MSFCSGISLYVLSHYGELLQLVLHELRELPDMLPSPVCVEVVMRDEGSVK